MDYVQEQTRLGELSGEWTTLSDVVIFIVVAFLAFTLLILGYVAWLKGRKLGSALVWLVLIAGLAWFMAPTSWTQSWALDEATVSLGIGIAAGIALLLGILVAVRLAKPSSWWAQRRYPSDKYDQAVERHGWSRIRAR